MRENTRKGNKVHTKSIQHMYRTHRGPAIREDAKSQHAVRRLVSVGEVVDPATEVKWR